MPLSSPLDYVFANTNYSIYRVFALHETGFANGKGNVLLIETYLDMNGIEF